MSSKPGELSRQLNEESKFREIKKGTRRKFKGSSFVWNGKRWIESAGAWKDVGRGIKHRTTQAGDALKTSRNKRKQALIGKGTEKTTSTDNNSKSNTSSNKVNSQNKVSGNGGSSESTVTNVTNKNKEVKTNKEAWKTDAAKKWLEKTRNSPAAKAGFDEKERWLLQKQHREWKAKRGR